MEKLGYPAGSPKRRSDLRSPDPPVGSSQGRLDISPSQRFHLFVGKDRDRVQRHIGAEGKGAPFASAIGRSWTVTPVRRPGWGVVRRFHPGGDLAAFCSIPEGGRAQGKDGESLVEVFPESTGTDLIQEQGPSAGHFQPARETWRDPLALDPARKGTGRRHL